MARAQAISALAGLPCALAALPVRIEPGPLFRFGVIQVSGVAARPVGDVRALAQIEADEPYTARAVASARARMREI